MEDFSGDSNKLARIFHAADRENRVGGSAIGGNVSAYRRIGERGNRYADTFLASALENNWSRVMVCHKRTVQ